MTRFISLQIKNFRRFSGQHKIPLSSNGQVTLIAAQNGVGKTTILEAFELTLHGKRAFLERYSGEKFGEWLEMNYSNDAKEEFKSINFTLVLEDSIHGEVRIQRTYWLTSETKGGYTEELGVTCDGKQLELEEGENRIDFCESWIEAFFPRPIARRFLVDGERLSGFDTKLIDKQMVESIDDLLDIGLLSRLESHLKKINLGITKSMIPQEDHDTLDNLLTVVTEYQTEVDSLKESIIQCEEEKESVQCRIEELNKLFQSESIEEEGEVAKLRIDYAIKQSELTNLRRSVQDIMSSTLPFLIAGFPTDLDEWELAEVKSAIESERLTDENLKFLDTVLTSLNPPLGKKNLARIHKSSEELAQSSIADSVKSPLSHFDFATFTAFEKRVSELSIIGSRGDIEQIISESIQKLKQFEMTSQKIRKATEGLNIAELANELKSNGMALGGLQADYSRMNDEINAKIAAIESVEAQITSLKRKIGQDSSLQRKQEIVEKLQIVLSKYGIEHRATVAKPLEEAFAEGFRLLSRKADRIEEVTINPETYQTELKMQGFEGNWLDRDLSATEKQHVGLSLLFALRKVGNRAIPVVIDTPTSRMDSEHKGWSVTRFYPQLSHQVIVLATSDDLSNGLYEELLSTKALGAELLVEEISNDSVAVRSANLAAFFGV